MSGPILLLVSLLLLGALGLAFIRLLRGPSLPDRVVALDLISVIGVGLVATYAVTVNQPVFLDVIMVFALISFLGTVAFAYYLERKTKNARGD
ncbi:MAG: cation:proton antiporter [Chloroflexota bacterium]|nr:MAG: cation:proton antiporter [Chloroflexota bacterium]